MRRRVHSRCWQAISSVFRKMMLGGTMSIVLISLFLIFQAADSGAAKTKELTMASLFPPESPSAQSLNRWAEKIKQDTNGQISIRHFPANTLIAAPDMRTSLKFGVADIGCSFVYKPEPNFDPSLMLSQLILGLDYENCLKIFEDMWNKFPEMWAGQWKDYKLLWITTIDPNLLVTVKKPVKALDDMKGLQLRIPNAMTASMIKNLDATPVSMSSGDWIVSLDKGTTDGAATSLGSLLDYKIGEKIDFITNYSLGPGILFLAMNKKSWSRLSPDIQTVFDASAKWGKQDIIKTKKESEAKAIQYLKSNGVEFFKLSPDEYAKWGKTIQPVFDKMATDLNAKGFPGTAMVNYALERARFYSKSE